MMVVVISFNVDFNDMWSSDYAFNIQFVKIVRTKKQKKLLIKCLQDPLILINPLIAMSLIIFNTLCITLYVIS